MITWGWHRELDAADRAEVEALLAESVEYDEEAGFSTARPDAEPLGEVRHLVVTMPPAGSRGSAELDRLPDVRVVAYLRLDVVDGVGAVQFVVRPPFRSRGVGTLLMEQLDAASEGWAAVDGLHTLDVWAHGAHPAAERMGGRFGATVEDAVFRTLRMLGGSRPFVEQVAPTRHTATKDDGHEVVAGHRGAMSPHDLVILDRITDRLEVEGAMGRVLLGVDGEQPATQVATMTVVGGGDGDGGVSRADLRALVVQSLLVLQGEGARVVQAHVHALNDAMVSVARELELIHDQSDLLYRRRLSSV